MKLTEKEYYQFLRIHPALVHFVALNEKLIDKNVSLKEFQDFSAEERFPIRNRLYEKIVYLDKFINENPYDLSDEDLAIAREFKHFKKGKFLVVKYLKDYTVFLENEYAYGVLALSDSFDWFWGDNLPMMVEAILLPFKDKIIYDGIIQTYSVSFGRGISSSMKNNYNKAKAKYGIITSLPIDSKTQRLKFTDEDKLRLYMKNASSRDQNWYEIEELIDSNPSLRSLYYHLWGKINSRGKRKALKELDIKNYYFAIYNDVIIASGKTKKDVETQLKQMLNTEEIKATYLFKV